MLNKALTDSWSFFKIHFIAISIIILPIVVPLEMVAALYNYYNPAENPATSQQFFLMGVSFALYPIYSVAIVFYISSVIAGETYDTNTLWKLGIKYWLPFIVLSVIVGLVVAFGLMLFIIPGIVLTIRYAFSEFELLLNENTPINAMKISWDSTKDYMWVIFAGYVVITICIYIPFYFILSLFDKASISHGVLYAVANVAYSVLGALYTIYAYRIYEFSKNSKTDNSSEIVNP